MNIAFKTRNFYADELRLLRTIKTQKEKEANGKIKVYHFIIAGILGTGLTFITTLIPDSLWTFLFGTIAVFAFSFIVFMPYEFIKQTKNIKPFWCQLTSLIDKGTINTWQIKTKRIAVAPEYEDESDLYIIELNENEVLFLWDTEYNLNKKFPCLDFEIYEDDFFKLLGKQIYTSSEKIKPIKIDKKAKWNYMKQYGVSGHLETEKINFDELISRYNNCA